MLTIGWDLHQCTQTLAIFDERTGECNTHTIRGRPSAAIAWLRRLGRPFQIAFEATTGYGRVHEALSAIARRVAVAHPGKLAAIFKSKRKFDRADAQTIGQLLRIDALPEVWVPPLGVRQWRGLIEHRHALVGKRASAKCAVRALLRTHELDPPRPDSLWTKAGRAWLGGLELPGLGDALRRDQLLMEIEHLEAMAGRVEKELNRIGSLHPQVKLLRTIPGVGPRTAEAVVAYVGDPHRFARHNRIGAYFGLVPRQDESAGRTRLGHITKDGPATVRWLIVEAAWQLIRRCPAMQQRFDRITGGRKSRRKIALVAIARQLLGMMLAMLKTDQPWRQPTPADAAIADARVTATTTATPMTERS
jgi:transposase